RLPTAAEGSTWFANEPDALCIICGRVSGHGEMIDFDAGGASYDAWARRVPHDLLSKLVIETTQRGGRHVWYRCESEVCGNMKLAQRLDGARTTTLIETRGEGGLFLCAPTAGYEVVQGDLANPPALTMAERDVLLQAAWDLNEYVPPVMNGSMGSADIGHQTPTNTDRPGDDFNVRGDVHSVLEQYGWSRVRGGENEYWRRPGKDAGTSATLKDRVFYVFSSNAAPFEPNRAYSPFAVYALLTYDGDFEQAARSLRELGFGSDSLVEGNNGADISAIVQMSASTTGNGSSTPAPEITDPGTIPEHLFCVPGFVADVMDFTLANAPYPNVGLAFCGAIALQSYLCGRKVCDAGDLRPNIYLLALASSGTGKDFPRKVNSRVLFEIGHVGALGDKFASGEGIQDALVRTNAMLFQNDEMDGVLRQINLDRENKRESIPNILLTLYTSANDVYPMRVKAGQKEAAHIDQPHLTLFGTATPQYFYESLSQRMLTNGFFARLIIVDIGKRGEGQTPGSARHLPDAVIEAARWWSDFQPGKRRANLLEVHPEPRVVHCTPEAVEAITALQRQTEHEYDQAHARNDEVARVAWSRTHENAKKLALIYACSVRYEDPVIDRKAIQWASAFAMHQTRRQLFLAANYVAENPFHAECLKLTRKLREAPGQELPHSVLLKRMKMKTKDFKELIETLVQRGDVLPISVATDGRHGQTYRLATGEER
ncbi:MAG TPA: DUF3987 domain-containing protein, partial [Phycisphaerae bacterium]|nr:DUF3987 domain-containing protein [Phycisphaerae bacterium]